MFLRFSRNFNQFIYLFLNAKMFVQGEYGCVGGHVVKHNWMLWASTGKTRYNRKLMQMLPETVVSNTVVVKVN